MSRRAAGGRFLSDARRTVPGVSRNPGTQVGFATFDTAIGWCAIAWSSSALVGVWLPEHSRDVLTRRVLRRHTGAVEQAPPPFAADAIERLVALLAGDDPDLSQLPLDLDDVPEFNRRVYALARTLPRGVTLTYGEVATRIGAPGSAQAVGQALGANPFPLVVPCHRVVAAGGGHGGFSAPGGVDTKLRLLAIEGATLF